ncbi:MAG: beta-carotene 15,15'-monooxygenase [Pedobacter sp.]|nr:MAG: beta-carotene 15,15'-monooxygenase [Pedobacter sp.]
MINLFRRSNIGNLIGLLIYTFFLRMAIFFNGPEKWNFEFLEPYTKLLLQIPKTALLNPGPNVMVAAILVFVQALWFNRIVNNHGLLQKPSDLPALMYISGSSLFLQFQIISPPLVCNFLLLWMMDKFLKLGKSNNALYMLFDIGMLIALGTLIYFPFVVLLSMLWLSLLLYRSFNWREWIAGLFGFLTIFFILGVIFYWQGNFSSFKQIWLPLTNSFPTVFDINYKDYFVLIPVIIMIILALLQLRENFFRSFINTRKAFQMLFFMFVVGVLGFYTKPDFRLYHFLLCVPPGAVLLAYYFSNAKIRWFYESLFAIFVICMQYFLFV